MWLCSRYEFAGTFSYRLPNFSTSYAASSVAPSPSTVKLALTSAAICIHGDVSKGEEVFESVKIREVKVKPPQRITIFRAFLKRLKKGRKKILENTFGVREYAIFDSPLSIYIDIDNKIRDSIVNALKSIHHFGTSDSLCTCVDVASEDPAAGITSKRFNGDEKKGIIFLLTDFTEKVKFSNINIYDKTKLDQQHLIQQPYIFPLKIIDQGKSHTTYELEPF